MAFEMASDGLFSASVMVVMGCLDRVPHKCNKWPLSGPATVYSRQVSRF